jgi:hypothetical protein
LTLREIVSILPDSGAGVRGSLSFCYFEAAGYLCLIKRIPPAH